MESVHSVIPLHWTLCHQWRQSRLKSWGSQRKRGRGSIWFSHWSYQTSDLLPLIRKQALGLFLQKKIILKNLSNTLPVARWNSPSRGRKPHEGSSTGIAVVGPRALLWPPHITRGSFMTAVSQQEPRGLVTAPRGPHLHQTEHGDLCWLIAFRDNIYINTLSAFSVPLSTGCWFF